MDIKMHCVRWSFPKTICESQVSLIVALNLTRGPSLRPPVSSAHRSVPLNPLKGCDVVQTSHLMYVKSHFATFSQVEPSGFWRLSHQKSIYSIKRGDHPPTPTLPNWPRLLLPEPSWNQLHKPQTWLWSGRPPTAPCTSGLYSLAWHSCHLLLIPVSGCRPPGGGHQTWCCVFQRIDMWSLGVTACCSERSLDLEKQLRYAKF